MKPNTTDDELEQILVTVFKLGMLDAAGGRSKPDPMPVLKGQHRKLEVLISRKELEARIDELENLKTMLAGFTWGPYNPFEIINTRLDQLNSKRGSNG